MFNNNDQQQQRRPAPRRHQPPPQQQHQYQFGLGEQSNNNNNNPQQQRVYDEQYHQYPPPPAQQQSHPSQHFQGANLSGGLSWMANQTINRPTISRSTGVGGGGGEILPPPPPGLGEGTGGVGTTMSLLPEDPPTISSTFARGAEGGNPWSGGGVGGGGGAFAAPPSSSGGLHSGDPYRGPTTPAPGSGCGQPRYQQDQQDYGGGNAFAPPFYPSPQPMEGVSPPRRMWQNQGPVPTSFKPAPPTSLARQSSGKVVEVQEVPSSYRQSPSYDRGGEGDALPPYMYAMHPAQQQGYQLDGQYHSQHQQQVGPMGSIGQYSSNHHLQYPSSSPQRPYSRSSSRSYQSSSGPSPSRGGRGRGGGGAGRGRGGGGGRGGQARPLSRNSSQGARIRTPSPALSELEVFSSPSRQQRPDSAASDTSRSPRTPRPSSVSSHGSNSSGGSRRSGGRRSGGRPKSRSDSRNSTESPAPQNLRGDPFRKSKIKTELCRNFMQSGICQYADKCNYAHGKDDLKFQTLLELDNGGVTDVEIYRTRVCFTWVATGSCPFEQRCGGLHDPRVIGPEKHWLPHAEMRTLTSVNSKYTNLRRLPVFRLLSLDVGVSDYNEIMEIPILSPRRRTSSPEVLEISLLLPRRAPSPQSIPSEMETFFEEWEELFAYTTHTGPFQRDEEANEGSEEQKEVEEAKEEEKAEEEVRSFASPVAINDDGIIDYLNQAAAMETRSSA